MVDSQSMPDSAVSPSYSRQHSFHSGLYDVHMPLLSLDQFYYPAGPPPSSLSLTGPAQTSVGGLDVHACGYDAGRLHHGSTKRLRYPAVDQVDYLPCQQSSQTWNSVSVAAGHGTWRSVVLQAASSFSTLWRFLAERLNCIAKFGYK